MSDDLTITHIHELTGIPKRTLLYHIYCGNLPAWRPAESTHAYLVKRDDLTAWLRNYDPTKAAALTAALRRRREKAS